MIEQRPSALEENREQTAAVSGRNPYVFIVGCIRSGTTLLQRLVDAHPAIAVVHETHWIPRLYKDRTCVTRGGTVTLNLIRQLCDDTRFTHLGMDRAAIERLIQPGEHVQFPTFVARIFDRYASDRGKPLAGDKTPAYVKHIRLLHRLWPGARFVHLIRDGRDVSLSITTWKKAGNNAGGVVTWEEDPVTTAALYWKRKVQLGREGGFTLPPDLYYEIRYEALVRRPADECAKLCAFLGLPYDDAMLRFHEGRTRTKPGLDAKHAWLPVTAGLRDWKREMPAAEIERFEAAAGELLDELGYERAFPEPGRAAIEHAVRMRRLFTEEMRRRQDRLPERW